MKTGGGKGNKQPQPRFGMIETKRVSVKYMPMYTVNPHLRFFGEQWI
jgi:hypothetical protein